jgi:hypothetical protein
VEEPVLRLGLALAVFVAGCNDFAALTRCDARANLIKNSTFEQVGAQYWSPYNSSLTTTVEAHTGNAAGDLCKSGAGSYFSVSPSTTLLTSSPQPGTSFFASAWARSPSGTTQPLILYFRERGAPSDMSFPTTTVMLNSDWQLVEGTHAVAGTNQNVDFYLSAEPSTVDLCVDFDDVCFMQGQ